MISYDAWKSDEPVNELELQAEAAWADEPMRLRVPLYHLHVFHDRWLKITTARLLVMHVPREGWRKLDESVCPGDDSAEALRRLRLHRHHARSYAVAS